jgi:hypothetical protein
MRYFSLLSKALKLPYPKISVSYASVFMRQLSRVIDATHMCQKIKIKYDNAYASISLPQKNSRDTIYRIFLIEIILNM